MKPKILFNKKTVPLILEAFNLCVNGQGIIVWKEDGEPILTPEGDELTIDTFGGMKMAKDGSPMFFKKDLLTAIKLVENKYE